MAAIINGRVSAGNTPTALKFFLSASKAKNGEGLEVIVNISTRKIITVYRR